MRDLVVESDHCRAIHHLGLWYRQRRVDSVAHTVQSVIYSLRVNPGGGDVSALPLLGVYYWGSPGTACQSRQQKCPLVGLRGGWGPPVMNQKTFFYMDQTNLKTSPNPNPNKSQRGTAGANPRLGSSKRQCTSLLEPPGSPDGIWYTPPASQGWPSFLVVNPVESSQRMSQLSVFVVDRALKAIGIAKPKSTERFGSSGLLVEVSSRKQADSLLSLKNIDHMKIRVEEHRSLNSSRGVVKSRDLDGCTPEEMVKEIEGVVQARRMMRKEGGVLKNTNTWVLTFDSPKPPPRLQVAYLDLEVRPYVPNPMRCYQCHRFGHTSKKCRRQPVCANCGQGEHEAQGCKATPRCLNCQGGHTASSKACPKYVQEQQILKYKASNGGTFVQVRKLLFPAGPKRDTYASVTANGATSTTKTSSASRKDGVIHFGNPPSAQNKKPDPVKNISDKGPGVAKPFTTPNRFAPISVPDTEEEMEIAPSCSGPPPPPLLSLSIDPPPNLFLSSPADPPSVGLPPSPPSSSPPSSPRLPPSGQPPPSGPLPRAGPSSSGPVREGRSNSSGSARRGRSDSSGSRTRPAVPPKPPSPKQQPSKDAAGGKKTVHLPGSSQADGKKKEGGRSGLKPGLQPSTIPNKPQNG